MTNVLADDHVRARARADALWFAKTLQDTCGHLWVTGTLEADIERAAANHVEARMAALRAEGCGEAEVAVYPIAFALAIGEHQADVRVSLDQIAAGASLN